MVVAARAPERDSHNARSHDVSHLRELLVTAARHGLVAGIAAYRCEPIEARGDQRLVFLWSDFVAGQLFLNETVVWRVVVESADHIVAITPGIGAEVVVLEAFGLGEAHDVQPVVAPVLAIMLAREKTVDNCFPGFRRSVVYECGYFGGRGGQTGEIECYTAEERGAVCLRRVGEALLPHARENERINRGFSPSLVGGAVENGRRGMGAWQESPVTTLRGGIFPEWS